MSVLTERIRRVLDLREGEGPPVAAMTAYFMLLIFAFLIGRTVRDALFLSNFGIDKLPWMYVGTALVMTVVSQVYTRFAIRANPKVLSYAVALGFAGSFMLFRLVVEGEPNLLNYSALYLWVEVFGGVALMEFWGLAGEVFEQRQAKRLYGLVSAGQVFSNLLCGAASTLLSGRWGAENLLWLAAAALISVIPLQVWLDGRRKGQRNAKKAPPKIDKSDPAYKKHIGYLRTIAAVVALTFLSTSIIDFQFKLSAKAAFPDKDAMAAFFGTFYAAIGIFGFFLQTFFTGRITKALGVLETLAIMPGFFLVGSIGQIAFPGLYAATATKFSENTLRYSINDPVTQLLYLPLPNSLRLRALALASGTIKPWAMGGAGLLMLAVASFTSGEPQIFSYFVVILCGGWLALLVSLKRGYLGAVASGAEESRRLVWQRPKLDPHDPLVRETVLKTLEEADPEKIDYALDLASRFDIDGLERYLHICLKRSGPGRALVLRALEARREKTFSLEMRELATSTEPPVVHGAALRALASVDGERTISLLRKALGDKSPVVRAQALEALVLYCGGKGLSMALATLDEMLYAADSAERVLAIRVIAKTPVPHPFQLLEPIIDDPDVEVAREAIRAVGVRCDEEAIWPLLDVLSKPATSVVVGEGLARFGSPVVEPLTSYLRDASREAIVRDAALKGLAANESPLAGDAIAESLAGLPQALREHAATALQRKVRGGHWTVGEHTREVLEKACRQQIQEAAWYKVLATTAQDLPDVLRTALAEQVVAAELLALRICSLWIPNEEEVWVLCRSAVLTDDRKRQLLIEILDNVLSGDIKETLVALLDGSDPAVLKAYGSKFLPIVPERSEQLHALTKSGNRWLTACAVWSAVKTDAFSIFQSMEDGKHMIDLVEKVLLLKTATLFQHLTGADIEKIASIAQECSFEARQPVFEQGDPGDALYVVTRGQVKVHIGEKELALLNERDCFGEMAILDDQPRSASVTAETPVQCLSIRRDDFFFLLEDHFEIVKSIIRVLSERLRNTNQSQAAPPPPEPIAGS